MSAATPDAKHSSSPPAPETPDTNRPRFLGRLLPHQHDGVRWLARREADEQSPGGILADDMGLGKTVQILAMMCRSPAKTLIVCPKSIVDQWTHQIASFTDLEHVHLAASLGSVNDVRRAAARTQVCVCTYEFLLSFDVSCASFERIVLDEAHRIRNTRSKTHACIKSIPSRIRWAVTGTPLLSRKRDFDALVAWISSRARVPPSEIMLRRTFDDLGGDRVKLPPCEFVNHVVDLCREEKAAYNRIVESGLRTKTSSHRPDDDHLLRTLFKLQQCLVSLDFVNESWIGVGTKILKCMDLAAPKTVRRLLVFTHHRNELDVVSAACEMSGCVVETMDGQTSGTQRGNVMRWFNDTDGTDRRALVTNLVVGGVGLNLQATDTIIFVSPDWTPSLEMQAVARAHRIGCSHRVTVHRIIARGTIDEHVARMQSRKLDEVAALFDDQRVRKRFGGHLMDPADVQSILTPVV